MTIWGNHSSTQYPDISHCLVDGKPAQSLVQREWVEQTFIPVVQQRGAAIIKARGASSGGIGRLRGHRSCARLGARYTRRLAFEGLSLVSRFYRAFGGLASAAPPTGRS